MKRNLAFFGLLLCASWQIGTAQYAVYPSSTHLPKQTENALFYSLPQNSYRITVEVEETILKRGIYADYAEKLLKLHAVKENTVEYKIKSVEIKTLAHPDPEQVFALQGSALPAMQLTPEGLLLEVNPLPHAPFNNKKCGKDEKNKPQEDAPQANEPTSVPGLSAVPVAEMNIRQKFDTIIRQHTTDSLTVVEKILRPVADEKSLAEQARKMADLILKLQTSKSELLSGLQEVAYPAGTMEFMYTQMEKNENRYLECFTGTMHKEHAQYTFVITPQKDMTDYPVASFSEEDGIKALDESQRKALRKSGHFENVLLLQLSPLPYGGEESARFVKANVSKEKPGGFYYRLPLKAAASITLDGKVLTGQEVFVAQWGKVLQLPVREHYSIRLDKVSGGLKFFGLPQQPAKR